MDRLNNFIENPSYLRGPSLLPPGADRGTHSEPGRTSNNSNDNLTILRQLHESMYLHFNNCNMPNTANSLLKESQYYPNCVASNTAIPLDLLSLWWNYSARPLISQNGSLMVSAIKPEDPVRNLVQIPCSESSSQNISSVPTKDISAQGNSVSFPQTLDDDDCQIIKDPYQSNDKEAYMKTLFLCRYPGCKSSFTTSANMKRHERLHSGEKPYGCDHDQCGKRFARKYDLKIHLRIHTKEKPYICEVDNCKRKFSRSSSLREHERHIHGPSGDGIPNVTNVDGDSTSTLKLIETNNLISSNSTAAMTTNTLNLIGNSNIVSESPAVEVNNFLEERPTALPWDELFKAFDASPTLI